MIDERRAAIDVARVLALGVVVLGHLGLAVIDTADGEVRGANLFELRPGWAWLALVAPMPVFFAAGGWAGLTATARSAGPRLRTLAGLGAVVVCCWTVAVTTAVVITGDAGVVGDGARLATQPLWFLAAYAPMAAAGRSLGVMASRRPVVLLTSCVVVLAALDIGRFALDLPDWVGWLGFPVAWGVPWLAGGWWRQRVAAGSVNERAVGATLLVVFGAGGLALVHLAGYSAALIDVVPDARSNTTPPTLYTAVAGLAQVGVLITAADGFDMVGRRWRYTLDRAGQAAVGVYVWHLTAMALCAAVIAAGLPVPTRLSGLWWATRPLWFAAVLVVTAALVALTAAGRAGLAKRRVVRSCPSTRRLWIGVVTMTAAAAAVGLEGPREPWQGLAWTALFAAAWLLLGGRRRR